MINTLVWCLIAVTIKSETYIPDTAAKGKIIKSQGEYYFVDFSEYARKQNYMGDYYNIKVEKELCFEAYK